MRHAVRSLCFITLISCVNHDFNNNSPRVVLSVARMLCNASSEDMQWLKTLVQKSETDYSLRGPMYAVPFDDRIIFVHQPFIMSCYACVLYDCQGNKIDVSTIDREKLRKGMKPANLIYNPVLE